MADSQAFDRACALLEELTDLSRLEARGTVRIALKQSGLQSRSVLASELSVVVEAVMPAELETRGIPNTATVCERIVSALSRVSDGPSGESPESVFSRLGAGT